jgi:hypothetical protein
VLLRLPLLVQWRRRGLFQVRQGRERDRRAGARTPRTQPAEASGTGHERSRTGRAHAGYLPGADRSRRPAWHRDRRGRHSSWALGVGRIRSHITGPTVTSREWAWFSSVTIQGRMAWVDGVSRTAAEVMLTTPARHPLSATVGEIRDFFRDDHVHAALVVSPAGYLAAVVERDDVAGCQALDAAAAPLGRLAGRTVPAEANLAEVRRAMTATGRRRAAVTSADGRLLGLLCLKASRAGFCSDQDVRARALGEADRAAVSTTGVDRSGRLVSCSAQFLKMATAICAPLTTVSWSFS